MHVLVDPELLLLRLVLDLAARAHRARALVQRGDHAAAAVTRAISRDHPREVERVVQRGDAVDEVEGAVGERQVLAVGLHARERPDPRLVERAAADADVRVGEDVGARRTRRRAGRDAAPPTPFAAPTSSTRIPGRT